MTQRKEGMVPPILIQPFNLLLQRYDYYLSLHLEDHPKYDSIQALIMKRSDGPPLIRALTIRHDGSRVEHLNHEGLIQAHQASGRTQEAVYSPMVFSLGQAKGRPLAHLEFTTSRNEKAVLDLTCAREPTDRLGGLGDPGSFAAKTGLPLMWLDKVSFGSLKTRFELDHKAWAIPARTGGSVFRREVDALFCLGFSQGILGQEHRAAELVQAPSGLNPGEKWVFSSGPVKTVYTIAQQDGSSLVVRQESPLPKTIMAHVGGNHLDILRIEAHSGPLDPGGLVLAFVPPEPGTGALSSFFSLSLDDHPDLVTGRFRTIMEQGRAILRLEPEHPPWAVNRILETAIIRQGNMFQVHTAVARPRRS